MSDLARVTLTALSNISFPLARLEYHFSVFLTSLFSIILPYLVFPVQVPDSRFHRVFRES